MLYELPDRKYFYKKARNNRRKLSSVSNSLHLLANIIFQIIVTLKISEEVFANACPDRVVQSIKQKLLIRLSKKAMYFGLT